MGIKNKVYLGLVALLSVGVVVAMGYLLATMQQNISVGEAFQAEWKAEDGTWITLNLEQSTVLLDDLSLKVGEHSTQYYRFKNLGTEDLNVNVVVSDGTQLTHEFACGTSGINYRDVSSGNYDVKIPADGVWKEFGVETIASGDMAPMATTQFETDLSRTGALSEYDQVCV